jgi:hypothetical protein
MAGGKAAAGSSTSAFLADAAGSAQRPYERARDRTSSSRPKIPFVSGKRCGPVGEGEPLMVGYHDREWGVPPLTSMWQVET